jgi:predicted nuclease with TOPRIM domain
LFGWGTVKLYLGSNGKRVFDNYLTINELENNIRRIRVENSLLEDKLASLKAKVD